MLVNKNYRVSNEQRQAMKMMVKFGAQLVMLKSHYENHVNRALRFAALNQMKPHTADKELTEEEVKAILKQAEQDLKQAIKTAQSILSDDLVYLVRKQGFFSSIAVDMKKVITIDVPIAAVNVLNAISHLYINPITYPRLPKRERVGVLIHEILHLALFHVFRYLELPEDERHHYMWNLACDCAINQLVPNNSDIGLPEGAIFPETFKKYGIDMPPKLSAEEYYYILKDNQDKLPDDMNGGMDGDGDSDGDDNQDSQGNGNEGQGNQKGKSGQGKEGKEGKEQGSGQGKDGKHKNWHKKWGETKGNKKVNEAAVKNSVRRAYTREAGTISGELKRVIEEIIESKYPWYQKFQQYTAKYLKASFISTLKKESRRLGKLARGRRQKRKLKVLVGADTSASVSDENLAQFSGQIMKIWKAGVEVTIMEIDYDISDIYEFKGKIDRIQYKGNGGTSFLPLFEKVEKDNMEVDLIIYLTDGGGTAPDKCNIPTIWCLTPDGVIPDAKSGGKITWGDIIKMN